MSFGTFRAFSLHQQECVRFPPCMYDNIWSCAADHVKSVCRKYLVRSIYQAFNDCPFAPSHNLNVVCMFAPPLRCHQGVDTGAGMVVFESPITVATVSPGDGTHDGRVSQVCEQLSFPR